MSPPRGRNRVVVFFGWLLVAVGGVIAFTSGTCTLSFVVGGITQPNPDGLIVWLLLCLAIGAVPMAAGAGLAFLGWLMCRPAVTRRD
jgi:hypothetical protein